MPRRQFLASESGKIMKITAILLEDFSKRFSVSSRNPSKTADDHQLAASLFFGPQIASDCSGIFLMKFYGYVNDVL